MIGKVLTGAVTLTVLLAVPIGAEVYAGRQIQGEARLAAARLAPGASVVRVEPHGRPFLAALLGDEISSAYVDVRTPDGTTQLILQRLHRHTGRINTVLWFPRLPQPVPLTPDLTPGGAYTPSGSTELQGHQLHVTYTATIHDAEVRVRPSSVTVDGQATDLAALPAADLAALTPPPLAMSVPAGTDLAVRAVSVGENYVTVELRQRDATTRPADTVPPAAVPVA